MIKDYEQLFSKMTPPTPPAHLFEKIMILIHKEQRRRLGFRVLIFSIGLVGSLAALVPSFQDVQARFAESGFVTFLSLPFSDAKMVIANWQNFSMALLEALPIMSTVSFLAVVLILLGSLKYLANDIRFFNPHHLTPK